MLLVDVDDDSSSSFSATNVSRSFDGSFGADDFPKTDDFAPKTDVGAPLDELEEEANEGAGTLLIVSSPGSITSLGLVYEVEGGVVSSSMTSSTVTDSFRVGTGRDAAPNPNEDDLVGFAAANGESSSASSTVARRLCFFVAGCASWSSSYESLALKPF
jgi:hypothetical protein